jgi:hypothetical protein
MFDQFPVRKRQFRMFLQPFYKFARYPHVSSRIALLGEREQVENDRVLFRLSEAVDGHNGPRRQPLRR